ncbi:MAG TPA: TolC family protein [Thermoanaerobaculia bacterium]|nr:TolC family protein [Thermoanaerobaculia bacterium]
MIKTAATVWLAFLPLSGLAQAPMTLDDVLREAHAANARLPPAASESAIAQEKEREARAELWLKLSAEGDFIYAPASGYDPILTNLGEVRAQLVAQQPIYEGGARRGAVSKASAQLAAARAHYRMAEKDVDLEVRNQYAELLAAESEIRARQEGLERLTSYRSLLESRKASGQGIAADVLRTDVRIATAQADIGDAEQRRTETRLALNDLMGRDPRSPLMLAALPEPVAPATDQEAAWDSAPEVGAANAETSVAEADLRVAEAERKPHLFVRADTGFWGSDTEHLIPPDLKAKDPDANFGDRLRRDAGYSISLNFSWSLWNKGAMQARIAQARIGLDEARQRREVEWRHARLEWEQARENRINAYRQIETLSGAIPVTRDSYLEAESRYRGGAATSLEVLDAYAASVDTAIRLTSAALRYRLAQALELRWGTP